MALLPQRASTCFLPLMKPRCRKNSRAQASVHNPNPPLGRVPSFFSFFETGGELRDGKGAQIKMGNDSEPLRPIGERREGEGTSPEMNVKVA